MNGNLLTKYLKDLSNNFKIKSLTNYTFEVLSMHKQKIVPTLIATVFGGTMLYAWRNGVRTRQQKTRKGDKDLQIDVTRIPPEARKVIWANLSYQDLLNLRFVSDFTKDDVDNLVGLKIHISSKQVEKYEFSQAVALQSCTISDLTNEIGSQFFADPYLMLQMEIRERTSGISLTNLVNLLSPCINLTKLKLRFNHNSPISEISEIILNALPNMQQLAHLEVTRLATQPIQEKAFPINTSPGPFPYPKGLKHLKLEMPDVPDDHVATWRHIMEQQTQLTTLDIHLGAVHWEYFRRVIPQNHNLEQVVLLSLKGYRIDSEEEKPFDWTIFSDCNKLKSVEVTCTSTSGPRGADCLNTTNFQRLPCKDIEELYISRLIFTPEDVQKVYREMPLLTRGGLDQIGELGTATAAELSWQFHQQQLTERENWFTRERLWDAIFHAVIGVSIMVVITIASRTSSESPGNESQIEDLG